MTRPSFTDPDIRPLGDSALTVTVGEQVEVATVRRVHALARRVRDSALAGVREVVPGYSALTIFFDPTSTTHARVADAVRALATTADALEEDTTPRTHHIPVRYEGPDLGEVADRCGLRPDDVVALHSAPTYTVLLLGFAPGFGYLGPLDPRLHLPRRDTPRPRVPAGSVAIAGAQTAVYPLDTPGGWHLLGATTARLWDPERSEPALLAPGDQVRFEPC